MKKMPVTEENFWEARKSFERTSTNQAWLSLKWKYGVSLSIAILARLILAYVVIPATLMFIIFLIDSYMQGLATTINTVFIGHAETITDESAKKIVFMYNCIAILIFAITWAFYPWTSPVRRQVNIEMDRWWSKNGDKLPVAVPLKKNTIDS